MRILFISSEYPPETGYGGIGTYTQVAARLLSQAGHEVDVLSLLIEETAPCSKDGLVTVYRVAPEPFPLPKAKRLYYFRALCRRTLYSSLVRLSFAKAAGKACVRLFAEKPYDIIEAPECGAEAAYLKPFRKQLIVRLHTPWSLASRLDRLPLPWTDRVFTGILEKRGARMAVGVSAPSHAMARLLKQRWGLADVTVYPNPMDFDISPVSHQRGEYILYTGRVEYRKGIHTLIKAYDLLRKTNAEVPRLLLFGRPFGELRKGLSYESVVEKMIADKGLGQSVQWIKGGPREAVKTVLSKAIMAVYPSLWENYPYTCLEAMAAGVPVVASDCGGYPEMIVQAESGLLFPPLDASTLAEAMGSLLNHPQAATTMGEQARLAIREKCGAEAFVSAAVGFYERVRNGC
ncbi:MAG: hypothetical protein A2293_15815 [Elusimicrobia bacterium RIFOXYB2_FULL_49_7]|nr:MAG: hypothetical protein A2293_15815 [Elusimicrobia bacterium RIFOXYB2_FULL_49_7]